MLKKLIFTRSVIRFPLHYHGPPSSISSVDLKSIMGILRNELIPARHVGFVGCISIGGSGHFDTCTFVFPQRFAPLLSGLPDGEWSPVIRDGESTTGIVLYPACVTCIGNEFRFSTDNTVVYFDSSIDGIVRAISTEFHYEIAIDALEHATTESV